MINRIKRSPTMNCEGGWESHRWEVGRQDRKVGDLILFCNKCGCELKVAVPVKGFLWEVGEVNETENTVYLYDRENLEQELTLEVLEATA